MVQYNDGKRKSIAGINQGLYLESVFVDYGRDAKTHKLDKTKAPSIKAVIRKGRTNNPEKVGYKGAYLTNYSKLDQKGSTIGHLHQTFISLKALNSILKVNNKEPLSTNQLKEQAEKSANGDKHPLFNIHDGLGFNGNVFPLRKGERLIDGQPNPQYDPRAANCFIINQKEEKILPSAMPFDPDAEIKANHQSKESREAAIRDAKAEVNGERPTEPASQTPESASPEFDSLTNSVPDMEEDENDFGEY